MNKNSVRKIKVVSMGLVLLGCLLLFVPKYSGTGLRSESLQDVVVPGACYLPTEIETLNTTKIGLENQLADLNNQLAQANEDTTKNSENIANTSTKIETLNKELLTDVVLEQKKEILDKAQQELEDRKNIDDLKAELGTKQQYFNEQSASLKTAKTLLTTSTIKLDKLIIQVKAKKSLENNEKFLAEFLTNINKLPPQIVDLRVLESKEAALSAAQTTLNTTRSSSRATKAYNAALSAYNTELAKYKSKYKDYILPVIRPSTDLTSIYNMQRSKYNTQYSDHTRTKNLYTTTYKQSNTVSANDLKQLEITASQENKELKASHAQLTNTVTALKTELDAFQNNLNTSIKTYQTQYGYKTTIPDVTAIQSQYDKIEAEYGALQKKNDDIRAEIEKLNNDLAIYNNTLNDITGRISALQISINDKNTLIADYTNTIAQNNICPNTETYCRDSIDNDRDGGLDCSDFDCSASSECQTGTTENVSTVEIETPRETICNNHTDDDFDNAMDCSDSDCANDSYCQVVDTGTTISIPGEVCDNEIDDDGDGLVDCSDVDSCSGETSCVIVTQGEICEDGIDNDGNGATDCDDSVCSPTDYCADGKGKNNNAVCCVCIYGDVMPGVTMKKSCGEQFSEYKCTTQKSVYANTSQKVDAAISDFPNSCPANKYNSVQLLYEQHGVKNGEEEMFCSQLPTFILKTYVEEQGDIPDNIGIAHGKCNAFNDMRQAESYALKLSETLKAEGLNNVKITISGNQNNTGIDSNGGNSSMCAGEAQFTVCSEYAEKALDNCPPVGERCLYDKDSNRKIQCMENGQEVTMKCVPTGETFESGVPYGQYEKS